MKDIESGKYDNYEQHKKNKICINKNIFEYSLFILYSIIHIFIIFVIYIIYRY